jgi:dTDP-4-amino-4,6-dideoxygalactose transaminase
MMGINGRLDEIQAAVLKVKLPHLDGWINERRRLASIYDSRLPASLIKPKQMPWAKHVYYVYVIRSDRRDELKDWLEKKGVSAGIHYPVPIHKQEAWRSCGGAEVSLPLTEKITGEILSLPMYPELTDAEINYICDCVIEFQESKINRIVRR